MATDSIPKSKSGNFDAIEMADRSQLPPAPHPSAATLQSPKESSALRNSRFCFHCTKYETFIWIVALMGIAVSICKIGVITYYIPHLYDKYPDRSTYYLCGIGIILSAIALVWEVPVLYFVQSRKLSGLQQWMFAMMLHFLGSCLLATITGAYYERAGLFLSLSFLVDMVRTPPQMWFVHKFIKSEKLNEDSHFIAGYYKKF